MKVVALFLLIFSGSSQAAEKNCRLIIQHWHTSGKKVVEVTERHSATYVGCKMAAKQRELDSETDKNIVSTKVIFAYRAPSVVAADEEDAFLY